MSPPCGAVRSATDERDVEDLERPGLHADDLVAVVEPVLGTDVLGDLAWRPPTPSSAWASTSTSRRARRRSRRCRRTTAAPIATVGDRDADQRAEHEPEARAVRRVRAHRRRGGVARLLRGARRGRRRPVPPAVSSSVASASAERLPQPALLAARLLALAGALALGLGVSGGAAGRARAAGSDHRPCVLVEHVDRRASRGARPRAGA